MTNLKNSNQKWENFGDVNPIEHGGIFVKKDIEINSDTCYYIVKNVYDEDGEKHILYDLYIDISDDWIEKESVMDYIGMTKENFDPIFYAIGCTEYYNYLEFQGDRTECNEEELKRELSKRNIYY